MCNCYPDKLSLQAIIAEYTKQIMEDCLYDVTKMLAPASTPEVRSAMAIALFNARIDLEADSATSAE